MSRHHHKKPKKEDWGGEGQTHGSDDEFSNDNPNAPPRDVSMDALIRRGQTKSALTLSAKSTTTDEPGAGGVSSDENDSGVDSDSEQRGTAGADVSTNSRERVRETKIVDAVTGKEHKRRDQEAVATARLNAQGIGLVDDDEDGEDQGPAEREWRGKKQTEAEKQARKQKARETAAAAKKQQQADEDAEMADFEQDEHEVENDDTYLDPRQRQARMKALFDKSSDDKYMTFHADDPLRPNPNKARAAAREDEELEDNNTDPWLKQAADDAAREAEAELADGLVDGEGNPLSKFKKPLKASTDVFEHDDEIPPFDASAARQVMLKHMKPGETVLKAIKRLGEKPTGAATNGSKSSSSTPVIKTKMKNVRTKKPEDAAMETAVAPIDPAAEKARKQAFDELTEAAQGFLGSNAPEIYQDTYEKIARLVAAEQARLQAAQAHRAAPALAPAAPSATLDARARAAARLQRKRDARAAGLPEPDSSSDEEEISARPSASAAAASSAVSSTSAYPMPSPSPPPVELLWRYRWNATDEEVNGPYPTSKMLEWQRVGFLPGEVLVQRVTEPATNTWVKITQVDFTTGAITQATPTHAQEPPKKKFKF